MNQHAYKHLSIHERDLLAVLRGEGRSLREIAKKLGRSPATVSRELQRNVPPIRRGYYLAHKAQSRSDDRNRQSRTRRRLKDTRIRRRVAPRIRKGWSPELIAGWLNDQHPHLHVSHEAIYQWIYADARALIGCLVRSHRQRKNRGYSRRHKKSHIPERISIKERPKHIDKRRQAGHWETDTMISRKNLVALQVTVERKSRYTRLAKLKKKGSREMSVALTRRLSRYHPSLRRSITYDNGSENADHARTNRVLGTTSWFCEPYHSWERGTVENTIGIIRRFFPKKTDLAMIPQAKLKAVERGLNHRPRKCLGFKTPSGIFRAEGVALRG